MAIYLQTIQRPVDNIPKTIRYLFRNTTRVQYSKKYNLVNLTAPGTCNTIEQENLSSIITAIMGVGRVLNVSFGVMLRRTTDTDADYTYGTGTDFEYPKYTSIMDEIKWLTDYVFLGSNKNYTLNINGLEFEGTVDDFDFELTGDTAHSYIICNFTFHIGTKITF